MQGPFWLPQRIIPVALENYSVALENILVALGSPGWLGNSRGRHRQVGTDWQTLGLVRKSAHSWRIIGNTANRRCEAPTRGFPSSPRSIARRPSDRPESNRSNSELARRTLSLSPPSPTPLKRKYNAASAEKASRYLRSRRCGEGQS